jgi:DnaK suppressor protein
MAASKFTAGQLETFKKLLDKKRTGAMEEIEYCREDFETSLSESSGDTSTYSFHMADQGTDAQEREKKFMLASRQGKYLQQVESALERLDEGTYGICVSCGNLIREGRLKVVPTAKLCYDCKPPEE